VTRLGIGATQFVTSACPTSLACGSLRAPLAGPTSLACGSLRAPLAGPTSLACGSLPRD
jgi:hypothetical protein